MSSAHDEHDDDGEQHDEEDDNEQQDEAEKSFRDEAEAAPVTIREWVELDEDEEDDEEFDPDAAEEDEEEEDEVEEDEDEEEVEIDEDEKKALEEEALAEHDESAAGEGAQDEEDDDEEVDEGEGEEGEEGDVSVLESGASMMSGAAMSQFVNGVMKKDGPTVATVLLKADGTKEELVSTTTTHAGRVLQGKTSFLGQYPALDVIIMTRRDNESNQQLPRNQHTLPAPFDSDEVRGDVLLVRMDKNSEPQPFTLVEWQQFVDAAGNVPVGSAHSGDKRTERQGGDDEEAGKGEGDEQDGVSSTGAAYKKQRKT